MTSESTWFLEQPRLTKPMVVLASLVCAGFTGVERVSLMSGVDISAVYGRLKKAVNETLAKNRFLLLKCVYDPHVSRQETDHLALVFCGRDRRRHRGCRDGRRMQRLVQRGHPWRRQLYPHRLPDQRAGPVHVACHP